ncbi:MAG: SusE domain-containing protein, partial [Bacteroidales bacterium]|nr:SusE domain-containing protein [Bacteroidales bacterium]
MILTIEKSRKAEDALTLSWKGGAQEADYSILMDIAGNGFSKPYTNRLGKCPGRSVTFPSRDLNMTIAERWPAELARQTDFEFKVVATLGDRTEESGVARVRIS